MVPDHVMKYISIMLLIFSANSFAESLTNDSYKNVKIGTSEKQALESLGLYKDTKDLYGPGSSCYYLVPQDEKGADAIFMILDGRVSRIDNYDNKDVLTKDGLGIGSSKSEIVKHYKEVKVSPHPYVSPEGEYLEVRLGNGLGLIFETYHDMVTSFRLGDESIHYVEGCL